MIKSPDKQYNAYRILKVLSNQDYLAVDYAHLYYILSPVNNRHQAVTRTSSLKEQSQFNQGSLKILKPKQCIEIDHILYYVFKIGKNQVICANNVDLVKFNNHTHLFHFFAEAIREILKRLLMKDAKQVRKCIDIKNAIIIKGQLSLLDLNRGKIYPRSLQKSQKLGMNRSKDESFRKILQNEFRIIKYFGLLLWQIVYKSDYYAKNSRIDKIDEVDIVKKLLIEMINKSITYQYLQIKIGEEQQKESYSRQRKHKKLKFLIKKQTINRYTQSKKSQKKLQFKQISTQFFKPTLNSPCFSRKKRMVTEIQTGNQAVKAFPQRFFHLNPKTSNRFNSRCSAQHNSDSYRYENTKITDKLIRQGQLAKIRFNKFVQSKYSLKQQSQQINQTLRSKLISKMQRFKTEYKNYQTGRSQGPAFYSQNRMTPQWIEQEQTVSKKLQYNSSNKKQIAQNIQKEITKSKQKQQKKNNMFEKTSKEVQQSKINDQLQDQKQLAKQIDNKQQEIVKDKQTIEFQVVRLQSKPQQINNKINQQHFNNQNTTQILTKKTIQNAEKKTINYQEQQNQIKQHQNNRDSFLKKKLKIDSFQPTDQIQTIKLQKKVSEDKKQKVPIKIQYPPKKLKNNSSAPKANIQQLVMEYQSLINVLGHICSKALQNKKQFTHLIQWQKPLYFIYERYTFQRQKMQQALILGVKQITRKNRIVADQDWDQWLRSQNKQKFMQKIQHQNIQIRQNFTKFANKTLKQCSFSRKVDYYVRNKQKFISPSAIKARQVLSKITISFIVKTFDKMSENEIKNKQVSKLIFDCVYGALIISELDSMTDESQWVSLSNYQKYSFNLQKITPIVDLIYQLYYDQQTFNEID